MVLPRKVTGFILGCIALLAISGAARADVALPLSILSEANNEFATDLYGKLSTKSGNLFFSPYSIATALDMAFVGAKNDTATEIATMLHFEHLQASDNANMLRTTLLENIKKHELLDRTQQDGMELHVANALWGKEGYPFKPDFIADIHDNFSSPFTPIDFSNEPAARGKINDWVEYQTKGKIKDLIAPGVLDPGSSRLVLTNAIYFKAAWAEQFEKAATQKSVFHVTPNQTIPTDMMNKVGYFSLARLDGFRLLNIPYKSNEASMIILLPDRADGIATIENSLTGEKIESWINQAKPIHVALSLPKFKVTDSFMLKDQLVALGMKRAFYAGLADFTGIADVPNDPLYINAVIHKAFIDVDEEGTEAAAATAVLMTANAAAPGQPESFVADHPFLYMIRANHTGDILFIGRLVDPASES